MLQVKKTRKETEFHTYTHVTGKKTRKETEFHRYTHATGTTQSLPKMCLPLTVHENIL